MHLDAGRQRVLAFAADGLALARGKPGEEIVEGGVALVLPVELLVGALQEAAATERRPFRLGEKGYVRGGEVVGLGDFGERVGEGALHDFGERAGRREQARTGCRRERHGDLELGIVAAAGALKGVGPAVVEDILAARVGLHVAGRGTEEAAVFCLREQVPALPAGAAADRFRLLKAG